MSLQGKIQVSMHGAAGEVTGSCTLVEMEGLRFLVDCGMFQGGGDAYGKNQRALAFDVRHLDFVLLTHAHIDHSGLLPRLAMLGYRGPIYATAATTDLLQVLLLDSAHIQEKESEWQLRRSHRSGRGGRGLQPPLYTVTQAQECLKLLRAVDYDTPLHPAAGVSVRFRDAGHILGSAILEVQIDTADGPRKLVFSGDLGQPGRPVLRDPEFVAEADLLCIESTYGNRVHRPLEDTEAELIRAFEHTFGEKRGNIIIPAFAVGRTQEILYVLGGLVRQGRLPHLKIYVDSPMADAATRIILKYRHLWDDETRDLMAWQEANPQAVRVHFTADVEESMALNDIREGAVIISASGMCDAGRIKHHLAYNLPRPESTVLITGFQAAGTLGRRLVDGAWTVRLFGQIVPVRADVHTIGGLSAHADQQALLDWVGHFARAPGQVRVVHGEPEAAQALRDAIEQRYGWANVVVARCNDPVIV